MTVKQNRFPTSQAGVALLEFAFALPLLMMLLMGIIEYGRYTYFTIEIANAAHAGAEYGSQKASTASNTAGMQNAAIEDGQNSITPLTFSAVTPGYVCACWNGTTETPSPPTAAGCGLCASGRQVTYSQVTVQASISPLLNYGFLGLPASWTVTRTARIRVLQEGS